MNLEVIYGNMFNSKAQTIVNTVNCVGVMGKGIALVFKLKYPKMFDIYRILCKEKKIGIGKLWLYKGESDSPWVLNFPTKYHWKYPSKLEYIEKGLKNFIEIYKEQGITSIAFPILGTHNGGLNKSDVIPLMSKYLSNIYIPIEIIEYDPNANDGLFEAFSSKWNQFSFNEIKQYTGIRTDRIHTISECINKRKVSSMISLIKEPGIGLKTMEQCFKFIMTANSQKTLFD